MRGMMSERRSIRLVMHNALALRSMLAHVDCAANIVSRSGVIVIKRASQGCAQAIIACIQVAEVKRTMVDSVFGFFHDILVTENYYVLLENPTRMDFWKLLTQYTPGKACIAECLYVDKSRPLKVRLRLYLNRGAAVRQMHVL